jgi:hypothetical protein
MESIVIKAKNKAEFKFWLELIKKTGAEAMTINSEMIDEAVLKSRIENGMNSRDISRERIMNALEK